MGKTQFENLTDGELEAILLHVSKLLEARKNQTLKQATQTAPTRLSTSEDAEAENNAKRIRLEDARNTETPPRSDFKITTPTPLVRNQATPTTRPQPAKRPEVPPIIIREKKGWLKISAYLNNNNIKHEKARNTKEGIAVQTANEEEYRTLFKTLEALKISFHTYQLRSEKTLKIVMRGMIQDIPVEKIQEDLMNQNYEVIKITRLHGKDNKPAPLVMIDLDKKYKSIYELQKCCGLDVIIESKRVQQGI